MEDLSNVYLSPLPDSPYARPFRFNYTQAGMEKNWDMLEVHDSVIIIVFNVTRNVLLFVKQFRPAIYYNSIPPVDRQKVAIDTKQYPARLGITLEMCAGIVDKNKSLQEIAKEEVLEECGYDVPLESLQNIASYRAGVGVQGALQTMFYCEVTDEMKVGAGGGIGDEIIEVVEKTINEVENWISGSGTLNSPPSCLFALMWFLRHKADKFRKYAPADLPVLPKCKHNTKSLKCGSLTMSDLMNLPVGTNMKKEKVIDVCKLLQKHYGENWREQSDLNYYYNAEQAYLNGTSTSNEDNENEDIVCERVVENEQFV